MSGSVKCNVCNNITTNPSGFCHLHEGGSGRSYHVTDSHGGVGKTTVPHMLASVAASGAPSQLSASTPRVSAEDIKAMPGYEIVGDPEVNGDEITFRNSEGKVTATAYRDEGVAGNIDVDELPRYDEDGKRIYRDYQDEIDDYIDTVVSQHWPEWGQ